MIGQALKALARPAPAESEPARRRSCRSATSTAARRRGCPSTSTPGEIVGLYGLVGSGRSSVARTITGQRPAVPAGPSRCTVRWCILPTPGAAVAKSIAYLTEDRRLEGFVKDFDNGENMSLVVLPEDVKGGRRPGGRGEEARPAS